MKSIVVFYSYGGNTHRVAEYISNLLCADIVEIQTTEPYKGSYNDVVEQGQREVESGFMPKIKPINIDWSCYNAIILGTPVWWYTFAPAMKSFLESVDFSGKIIYPFATNGGWIGHTFKDFAKSIPSAKVEEGLNIRFDKDKQITSDMAIGKWVELIH